MVKRVNRSDELVRLELPREFVAELLEGLEMTRALMRRLAREAGEAGRPGDSAAAAATVRRAEAMMWLIQQSQQVDKSTSQQRRRRRARGHGAVRPGARPRARRGRRGRW